MTDKRTDIVTSGPSFGGRFEAGNIDLSQIEGRYFRTVEDIGVREERSESEGTGGVFGSFGIQKREVSWVARRAVKADTVLLALRMHFLDDILHSVEFAAHPEDPDRSNLRFMAEEFRTLFVPAPEGAAERDQAIERIQQDMRDINSSISADASRSVSSTPLLAPGGPRPTATDLVRNMDKAGALEIRMNQAVEAANAAKTEIEAKEQQIRGKTELLMRYFLEKPHVALAGLNQVITTGKELAEGVNTLSFYTGEDVQVMTVSRGESASPEEPLTLYQNMLFLDEELAVDLLDQGFDFTSIPEVGNILAADSRLLERMVPAPRGAVLVRTRREGKDYFPGKHDMASAMANAQLNLENEVTYLLVRDGGNVHLVHSEVTSGFTEHLFPTKKEIDGIFKLQGRDIRPEHLDYAKAKTDLEKRTLHYKRVLLMMWGLQDRETLFGPFYDQAAFDGWYDDRLHASRIRYVHDVENAIGESRPSFWQWAAGKNALIQPGSTLVCDFHALISRYSAPFCYEDTVNRNGDYKRRYGPVERFGATQVFVKDGRLTVRTRVDGRRRGEMNANIDLHRGLTGSPPAAVCIDDVTREDLRYYLNSRKERRNYLSYLHLFRIMDAEIAKRENEQETVIARLLAAFAHSGVPGDEAEAAVRSAVALWAPANGGVRPGGAGWKPKSSNQILDIAYALSGRRSDVFAEAVKALPEGSTPIELRINGKGQFVLYWQPPKSMKPSWADVAGEVFVSRSILRVTRSGIELDGDPTLTYLHNPGFFGSDYKDCHREFQNLVREVAIASDPEAVAAWSPRHLPGWLRAEEIEELARNCDFDAAQALSTMNAMEVANEISDVVRNVTIYKGEVNDGQVVIPLGVIIRKDAVSLLMLEQRGLDFMASLGMDALSQCKALIRHRYKYPADHLTRINKIADVADPDRPSMNLMMSEGWKGLGARINVIRGPHYRGQAVRVRESRWNSETRQYENDVHASLEDSFRREDPEARLVFLNDGSRKLAETYYREKLEKETT